MSSARDEILGNLRRSLRVGGNEAPRRAAVEGRLGFAPKGVIPARAQLDREGRIALFKRIAEAAQATVAVVDTPDAVPAEAARYLRDANLPATLRRGADPRLASLPWRETALEMAEGPSEGRDLNAISHAFGGVAESGTLVMVSGEENPTTLNFLPDNHIVVLDAHDLAGDYEAVFARLREKFGKHVMPRTVNFITGPSRSADIAQTMLLGAHGPRNLHVIVVDASSRNEAGAPSFHPSLGASRGGRGKGGRSMGDEKKTEGGKKEEDKLLTKEVKDTFPASDPPSSTQPSSGITGTEPPPKGQKTG